MPKQPDDADLESLVRRQRSLDGERVRAADGTTQEHLLDLRPGFEPARSISPGTAPEAHRHCLSREDVSGAEQLRGGPADHPDLARQQSIQNEEPMHLTGSRSPVFEGAISHLEQEPPRRHALPHERKQSRLQALG